MDEVEYLADRVALLVDGHVEAVDSVSGLVDTYAGEVKVVVRLTDRTTDDELESLESTLQDSATTVYRGDDGALIGVFDDRQVAQDAYSELHNQDTDHAIDLVSSGMDDVFLALAGQTLDAEGELR